MSLIKRNVLLSALTAATLIVASTAAQAEMVLHRGNGSEPETMDPQKSTGVTEANIQYEIFEGLTTYTPDGQVTPGAAEKWEVSDDGKTYTFHLRDAKWSNGDPVTAQDFHYSIRRLLDPQHHDRVGGGRPPIPVLAAVDVAVARRVGEQRIRGASFLGLIGERVVGRQLAAGVEREHLLARAVAQHPHERRHVPGVQLAGVVGHAAGQVERAQHDDPLPLQRPRLSVGGFLGFGRRLSPPPRGGCF